MSYVGPCIQFLLKVQCVTFFNSTAEARTKLLLAFIVFKQMLKFALLKGFE